MNKDLYIKIAKNQFKGKPKKIVIDQIIKFYEAKQNGAISKKVYKIGDVLILQENCYSDKTGIINDNTGNGSFLEV